MKTGKSQAMLVAAINSQAPLVIVQTHSFPFALELKRRALKMLDAGEGSRPPLSEMRFRVVGDPDRLRGLEVDVFTDHYVGQL